jgi:Spy/CpxP family protein refolding chaperone
MKLSTKVSALVLSLALAGGAAAAQKNRQHDHCARGDDIAARLQLNASQKDNLEKLMAKHREAMDKFRDAHEQAHEQERAEMKKLWDSQRSDVAAILTPKQLAEFDKMHQERERHRRPPMGMMGDMPPPPPAGDGPASAPSTN